MERNDYKKLKIKKNKQMRNQKLKTKPHLHYSKCSKGIIGRWYTLNQCHINSSVCAWDIHISRPITITLHLLKHIIVTEKFKINFFAIFKKLLSTFSVA